uniref:RNA polymerase alpha subunit n=1 Tax=Pallavicinia lyellii TaxID=56939 RepID=UPI001D10E70C|nr:RNA polymerase alpha subunit [Pallavicinia lyellii]QZZ24682.1 RNA polymerase alpha subunit [Pallavicinia lyellii]QZZ24766.1 RNA polymerase alpha subunit [Pallavicinia lyellii]
MAQDEIEVSTRTLQWRCIESRIESKRLLYGRFAISPFRRDQANTVGIAMRRSLLNEIEGTSITYAKINGIKHEYSALIGIQESIHDILINLKEIVLRNDSYESQKAYISVVGPRRIIAQDIKRPPSIRVIDDTQYVATLTGATLLNIELGIERGRGYRIGNNLQKYEEGFFPVDAVFMPVRNANYSVHSFESRGKTKEILFLEIWTDGSLTPKEALYEASRNLIDLFIPLMDSEREEHSFGVGRNESNMPYFPLQFVLPGPEEVTKNVAFKHIFIDQLELPARAYNCLKKVNVHTIADLLDYGQGDLTGIKNFGRKSIEQVLEALKKRFSIDLPKNKNLTD